MTILGPFYPSSAVSSPSGGVTWTNPGNAAGSPDGNETTADLGSSEAATDLLVLTGYGANVPTDAVVQAVRFVVLPTSAINGNFNPDAKNMIGVGSPVDLSQDGNKLRAEDGDAPTAAQVNGSGFGLSLSVYGSHGGLVKIESVALEVDVE